MHLPQNKTYQHGQGAVEYALILGLVAVVVILILFVIGPALQRVFGLVAGGLGSQYSTNGEHTVEIITAQCFVVESANQTGLWVVGNTDENVADLTGSTEQAVGTGLDGLESPVEENGPNGFKFHPMLAYKADAGACPKAVVIQAKDKAIAISPVTVVTLP